MPFDSFSLGEKHSQRANVLRLESGILRPRYISGDSLCSQGLYSRKRFFKCRVGCGFVWIVGCVFVIWIIE